MRSGGCELFDVTVSVLPFTMIEVKNLSKSYGNIHAVRDISFQIGKGEIVGFLGENGAGKSTVMNMLTGFLAPGAGEILIDGVSVVEQPVKAKKAIGYLPETAPLYPDLTVEEFLNYIFDAKRCRLDRRGHIDGICERVKISHVYKRLIKSLSKGYRQRVGIAQALIGDPKLLILDEPTVGLDVRQIVDIRNLIAEAGAETTVVLSSHILSEVQMVCKRILLIHNGKIVADGATDSLLENMSGEAGYILLTDCPRQALQNTGALSGVPDVGTGRKDGSFVRYQLPFFAEPDRLVGELVSGGYRVAEFKRDSLTLEDVFFKFVDEAGDVS